MPLTGEQYEKLVKALMSAFPLKSKLTQLLKFKLDKLLDIIVPDGSLQDIVFKLIEVAEAEGWTKDLVLAAREENPRNSELLLVAQELDLASQALGETPSKTLSKPRSRNLQVFLCHASADKSKVRLLYKMLSEAGCAPWLDEENILPGQTWQEEIRKSVKSTDVFLVCLSRRSFKHGGYRSGYMREEIRFALNEVSKKGDIYMIPVRLTNCQIPRELSNWHRVDLFKKNGFKKLIEALEIRSSGLDNVRLPKIVNSKVNENKPVKSIQKSIFIILSLFLVLVTVLSTDLQRKVLHSISLPERNEKPPNQTDPFELTIYTNELDPMKWEGLPITCPESESPFKVKSTDDGDFLTKKRKQSKHVLIIEVEKNLNRIYEMMPDRIIVDYLAPTGTNDFIKFFSEHLQNSSLHLLIDRNGNAAQLLPFNKQVSSYPSWNNLVPPKDFNIVISLVNSGFLTMSESGTWVTYFGNIIPEGEVIRAKHKNQGKVTGWHNFPPEQIQTFNYVSCTLAHYYNLTNILGSYDLTPSRQDAPGPAFPMYSVRNYVYGNSEQ